MKLQKLPNGQLVFLVSDLKQVNQKKLESLVGKFPQLMIRTQQLGRIDGSTGTSKGTTPQHHG